MTGTAALAQLAGGLVQLPALGTQVYAHGIGGRTDLPLPTWLATGGAVLAVALTFAAVNLRSPRVRTPGAAGRPLPVALQRVLDGPVLRGLLTALALVLSLVVVVVALTGPAQEGLNLAPYALYITFWVGLVPASLLAGRVWRVVNPLRVVHQGLATLLRLDSAGAPLTVPPRLGWWPAATWLALFVWLELVYPDRSLPTTVGVFLLVYALVNLVAAQFFGEAWFDRGDGFEAYSTLVGTLSPLGRRDDGRLVLRSPLDGALTLRDEPGLLAVVMVLVGSTAFDGVTRTRFWVEQVPADSVLLGTAGLAGVTLAITGAYGVATLAGGRLAGLPAGSGSAGKPAAVLAASVAASGTGSATGPVTGSGPVGAPDAEPVTVRRMPSLFAISLLPIAVGYAIAHYASLFVFEGQGTWILLSDPYATGANYFGTRAQAIDYTVVSATTIAYLQIGAIVLGHVVAVLVAHHRALQLFDARTARRSQYPLTAVMLLLTGMAVTLLLST